MLSHEPKNYALLEHGGALVLRGVAFRSSRAEPYGEDFLRRALARLLRGDAAGVRAAYLASVSALERRALPTRDVATRVRLTKTPAEYLAARDARREQSYEALLARGRTAWTAGEHVLVYRAARGAAGLLVDPETDDPRDYDVEHYMRLLRETFAARLERAFAPEDLAAVFADPHQLSLFSRPLSEIRPVLTSTQSVIPRDDER
jgi:hypothetical protein